MDSLLLAFETAQNNKSEPDFRGFTAETSAYVLPLSGEWQGLLGFSWKAGDPINLPDTRRNANTALPQDFPYAAFSYVVGTDITLTLDHYETIEALLSGVNPVERVTLVISGTTQDFVYRSCTVEKLRYSLLVAALRAGAAQLHRNAVLSAQTGPARKAANRFVATVEAEFAFGQIYAII